MLQEELDWPAKLTHRRGSAHLLAGVDLYFDFDWKSVINHQKRAFRNGRRLALLVKQDCPENRKPALLLTTLADADEGPRLSETHYVVVVKIDNYLKEGSADAAWTYFAQKFTSSGGLPSLHRYEQLVSSAEELDVLLERHLDAAALTRWLGSNDTRLDVLRSLVSARSAEAAATTPDDVAAAIETLEHVTPEICRSLTAVANRSDPESGVFEAIAGGVAESSYGRIAASRALAARVPDRLRDVGMTAQLYRALLENPDSTETDLQEFIESYPWILGLEYILVSPRRQVIRGAVDFLVQRHDGYHDFLELKGPNEDIVRTRGGERKNVPASASGYSLGPALGQALAQVQLYREVFTHAESSLELYGIRKSRYPRVVIVVGRAADLSDTEQLILGQLNQSLHRIEIVPYDILADRVEAQILNLNRLLTSGRDDPHSEAGT